MRKLLVLTVAGLATWAWPQLGFAQEAEATSMASNLLGMVPFALMFVVIYTLMLRPAQRQRKEQEDMLAALKRDDEVVTQSGLIGRIAAIDDAVVTLEVGERDRVKLRMVRERVSGLWDGKGKGGTAAASTKQGAAR
jgi:preprotein translocase subunit YajC